MVVHAYPAWKNSDRNPYNYLLSQALSGHGCRLHDPGRLESVTTRADVVHVHWPQNQLTGGLFSPLRALRLIGMLAIQRLRGARLVWTVHNVRRHDGSRDLAEQALMWCVGRLLHGLIFLGQESRAPTYDAMPSLRTKPFAVIPHGLYGDRYAHRPDRNAARARFGLPADKTIIGFAGEIRPYKGLERLIEAHEQLGADDCMLFIAGGFHDERYGQAITARIAQARERGAQIELREGWVSNDDMGSAVRAADLLVLPYQSSLNSGFALLTLELGARLLVPDAPVFRALQAELGDDWLRIMPDRLSADVLEAAVRWAARDHTDLVPPFDKSRAWDEIAEATIEFYRALGARSGA